MLKFGKIIFLCILVSTVTLSGCGGGGAGSDNMPGGGDDLPDDAQSVQIDTSFGLNGVTITNINNCNNILKAIIIQPDDKIIAAGSNNTNGANEDFIIVRYNKDGTLDASFGTGGYSTYEKSGTDDELVAVTLLPDGRIITCGYNRVPYSVDYKQMIVCYNSDGSINEDFGINGIINNVPGIIYDVKALADGNFLVCGYNLSGLGWNNAFVAKYKPDGTLNTDFNNTGSRSFIMTGYTTSNCAYSISIYSDKIFVAGKGQTELNGGTVSIIKCLNMNGTDDTMFGAESLVIVDVRPGFDDYFNKIVVSSNNKIYVTSYRYVYPAHTNFNVMCYNLNGSIDTTFGTDGVLTASVSNYSDDPSDIIVLNDESLFTCGVGTTMTDYDFAFAKFSASGILDCDFDGDGKMLYQLSDKQDRCRALGVQSNGDIIAAGYSKNINNYDFAIMRFKINAQ
ncbi:MAG: hypothetical protein CVV49_20685 [Spirochaetae bacterium HGW-Spirochaetae-5]|nr:MAG: hypothetical protein CVV49_20685 [Spirochaetae bacterium HGW-Spirochaetae-5]